MFGISNISYNSTMITHWKKKLFFEQLHDVLLFYTRSSPRLQKQKTILSLHEKNENYVERQKSYKKELSTRNLQHFTHYLSFLFSIFHNQDWKFLFKETDTNCLKALFLSFYPRIFLIIIWTLNGIISKSGAYEKLVLKWNLQILFCILMYPFYTAFGKTTFNVKINESVSRTCAFWQFPCLYLFVVSIV